MAATDHLVIGAAEAAQILGISRSTIQRWALSGKLPPLRKLGGTTGNFLFEAGVVRRKAEELRNTRKAS